MRTVFIATSLDGFIARPDHDVSWLTDPAYTPRDGTDFGYQDLIERTDAIVLGRRTYELVLGFDLWPYERPVVVLSSETPEIPEKLTDLVRHEQGDPAEIVERLAALGMTRLYIDGGETVRRFLDAGLIDELIVTRLPLLLGDGIPLFTTLAHERRFEHTRTEAYPEGLVQSAYRAIDGPSNQVEHDG